MKVCRDIGGHRGMRVHGISSSGLRVSFEGR